ncbi:purine phosphorylase [Exidia glandulosa HHB12029]|uniref:S-methyl-5'-thioadenosine phosphorylase n=1 Tax=Exidia glandulosa HHB12029 TaxID=1314781 RepID=A0A165C9P4_EXIGL|nr:purine phosphorylase [Exidia glandulosa HHB12029]
MSDPKVLIGVIGGSGLYHLNNLTLVKEVSPQTSLPSGTHVAFVARHGAHHTYLPSDVPSRANIAALKSIGVQAIVAFSAVGSLREEIRPGDFIIPGQIIDRTKGIRPASFFEGTRIVAHAMFGDPFDDPLRGVLQTLVKAALEKTGRDVRLHTDKTVVCMEGPQFSTRAESEMYRMWGGDIINMSVLPEAKLAREAELSYALIATATDYDSWRVSEEPVTVAEVIKTLTTNAETSRTVTETIIEELQAAILKADVVRSAKGSMQYSLISRRDYWPEEDRKKLEYILPEYFA